MSISLRFFNRPFFIKLRSWEYWPFGVVYFPVMFYWLWLSLKARSFFFFTSSNPSIDNGGMLGESKYKILRNISKKPSTYLYEKEVPVLQLEDELAKLDIRYPFICKPDIGERGWAVKKVSSYEEFEKYRQSIRVPFLIQNFVDLPIEAGVFYYRY
ncbi:MAG: hypothetical protein OEY34_08815, partial [Cyclobacteriaceae bacterium]|nr:hypothetical protein [Cyclobacteriaceae bacterium]